MPLNTISLRRPLGSYAKVQSWVGGLVRNRRFQLNRPRVRGGTHLDIGCGLNSHADLINLDYLWHPGIDVCWDITRGLPFADASLRGIFSEHCLEHFPLPAIRALLPEIRRILVPDGTARLIVPDGELYLRTYVQQLEGDENARFPFQEDEQSRGLWSPMVSVNRIFYQDRESLFGHRTIFDFQLLELLLRESGFTRVTRRQFQEGADPRLLIDTPDRRGESLYVEASP
jgi:predicted SAM-dependent methyltransferase